MLLTECPQYIWREEALHFSSVVQSCPTLWPHGLQHTRLSCPSPTPGSCSNSCPSSWWCHSTTSAGFGFWESGSVQQAFALGTKLHALGECVSSLSWTLCCRIDSWDWVWLSLRTWLMQNMPWVFPIGSLFIDSLMKNPTWFCLYIHFWNRPPLWLLYIWYYQGWGCKVWFPTKINQL